MKGKKPEDSFLKIPLSLQRMIIKTEEHAARDRVVHPSQDPRLPAVICLHGIMSRGKWQKKVNPLLVNAGFCPYHLDYGWYPVLQFLFPGSRRKKVDWFIEEYVTTCKLHGSDEPPHIIAHSFGSFLVWSALRRSGDFRVGKLILCGTFFNTDFNWNRRIEEAVIEKVLHQIGGKDLPVKLGSFALEDSGESGVRGFMQMMNGRNKYPDQLIQQYLQDHNHAYFDSLNMENVWIPFLQDKPLSQVPIDSLAKNRRFSALRNILIILLCVGVAFIAYRYLSP